MSSAEFAHGVLSVKLSFDVVVFDKGIALA